MSLEDKAEKICKAEAKAALDRIRRWLPMTDEEALTLRATLESVFIAGVLTGFSLTKYDK